MPVRDTGGAFRVGLSQALSTWAWGPALWEARGTGLTFQGEVHAQIPPDSRQGRAGSPRLPPALGNASSALCLPYPQVQTRNRRSAKSQFGQLNMAASRVGKATEDGIEKNKHTHTHTHTHTHVLILRSLSVSCSVVSDTLQPRGL